MRCGVARLLPSEGESGEGLHDMGGQISLPRMVLQRHIQRLSKHVLHLVAMHNAHPLAPEAGAGALESRKKLFKRIEHRIHNIVQDRNFTERTNTKKNYYSDDEINNSARKR